MFETPEPLKHIHQAKRILDELAGDTDPPGVQEEWETTAPLHFALWRINCALGPVYRQMEKDNDRIAELERENKKLKSELKRVCDNAEFIASSIEREFTHVYAVVSSRILEQVQENMRLEKRIAELERALKEIRGYGLTAPLGVEPNVNHYKRCCGDLIGIAARALEDNALEDE